MESIKQKSFDMSNFIEALKDNDISFIERFIKSGFDLNEYDSKYDGVTPLIFASIAGDASVIKMLIQAGANVNLGDKFNNTPLHWAADHGKTDKVEIFIREKANIEALNTYNETPLLYAMSKSQLITPVQLIQAGADVTVINKRGESADFFNKTHDLDLDHLINHKIVRNIEILFKKFYLYLSQIDESEDFTNIEFLKQSFSDLLSSIVEICKKNDISLKNSTNHEAILDSLDRVLNSLINIVKLEVSPNELLADYKFEQSSLIAISINELTKPLYSLLIS